MFASDAVVAHLMGASRAVNPWCDTRLTSTLTLTRSIALTLTLTHSFSPSLSLPSTVDHTLTRTGPGVALVVSARFVASK